MSAPKVDPGHELHPVQSRVPQDSCLPVALAAVSGIPFDEVLEVCRPYHPPPVAAAVMAATRLALEMEDLTRWVHGEPVDYMIASDRTPGPQGARLDGTSDADDQEVVRRLEREGWRHLTSPLYGLSARTRLAWGDRLPGGRYLLAFPTPWEDSDPEAGTGHVVALGVKPGRPRVQGFEGVFTVGEGGPPFPVESLEDLGVLRPVGVSALWRVLP